MFTNGTAYISYAICAFFPAKKKETTTKKPGSGFWLEAYPASRIVDEDVVEQCRDPSDVHSLLAHHKGIVLAHDQGQALHRRGQTGCVDSVGVCHRLLRTVQSQCKIVARACAIFG